jgi:pSer/pThr/pTyr-binding forkhead associated (FHA) protein
VSEITLTIVKVLFLALLWLFILFVASVIRSDLFGRAVSSADGTRQLQTPDRPRKVKKAKGQPRVLTITNGPTAGTQAELASGMVMIGRGADCQLLLDDDYVSTRHARLVAAETGIYIEDLGSTNGTYVNGMRISAPTTITLQDTVRIGKTVLKLET